MTKALAIVATAVLAACASMLLASTDASANERFWSGIKPSFSGPSRRYRAPTRVARPRAKAPSQEAETKGRDVQQAGPSKDTQYSESRVNPPAGNPPPVALPPVKTAEIPTEPPASTAPRTDFEPSRSPGCKKYFPSVGGMVNVPCEQ